MKARACCLVLALVMAMNAAGNEVASSARSASFAVDTEIVKNSTLTADGSMLPFRLDYSPSLWWDKTGEGRMARITINDETVHEATHDGTFLWSPSIAGVYSIKCISANNVTIEKRFNVVAPTVTIEREGYNLCKLTASDGVSEIRYTTDGTVPTADSPLYTGPFGVPPSRLSFVRAATFAVGCPQGEVKFAVFNPVGSFVSAVQANCVIDNSGETIMAGYDAIPLPYDTAWEGDSSSSMELRVDGDLIATRTGAGDVAWTPEREGMTTLTLRTVSDHGITQAEYSAQYDVVPRTVIISKGDVAPLRERYPGLCHWITNITIEAGVTDIGASAFAECSGLTSITIPDSVTSIGIGAFDGCDRITSVVLPDLTNIDAYMPGLIQAKFNANNDYTSSIADSDTADSVSGVLMGYAFDTSSASRTFTDPVYGGSYKWNGSNTTFGYLGYMHMVAGRTYVFGKYFDDTVYVKVDGVEVLKNTDHTAFATGTYIPENTGWHELEVRVADGTGEKGPKGAANGYSSYWSAEMGIGWRDDGITSVLPESEWHKLMDPGDGSLFRTEVNGSSVANLFPDAYAIITNIAWTGEVVNIPAHAFEGCAALRTMEIPTSVTNIGASAFAGCAALTEISIPSGVMSIGDVAFSGCAGFASVTIPDSVIRIGDGAFYGCSGLTSVTMPYRFRSQLGDSLNGCPITYIEDVPFIMFGDTYAYHNTSWGDYIEMDLKKANSMKVYVDGATPDSGIAHTHIALFEVAGASSKDEISPVVENLGFNGTLRAAVWTDEELRGAVLPPPSTAEEWESDGRSIDSRTPNDISGSCNFSHDPDYVYAYESDDGEFNWPQALWPDNKAVDDRFWVSVECQPSEVGRWGGVNGGFRVWQSGTEVKSEKMYVTYKTEGAWPCATNLPALFRGLPLANSDRYGFDISLWDVIHVAYGVPLHAYWLDATSEKPGAPLSITLPEAGILYMSAYDGDLDGISVENADAVERERVSWDEYEEMGSERYFYQYCADFMNRSVLAVKVNSAKTIRLVQEDDFEDYDIDRIQFFPNETKAVAVEASFVSIFDRNRYPRCSDNIGEYLQGYVTGTGVYRVGEMVALTAVPAPGEAFDHWELKYGNFPSGIDTTKTNLNFFVTDACAGTAEERMQMVVQAVWKAKRQIVATTENILQGMASGSGFYHDGASVMLAAQPAAGYAFAEWSDGFKTATRTVSVSGDAEYVARFVQLQTSPIEDVLGGGWTSGADGVAEAVGHYDATAAGDMSVKFTAADEASAWVETVVTNGCRVSFDWKSSCEDLVKGKPYDYLAFMVDGERQGFICGDTGWTSVTNYMTGAGEHVLRWTFLRDDEGSAGEDCAWLARVAVAPFVSVSFAAGGATSGTSPEPITACIGESIVLPGLGSLVWPKHTFLGWSDGERQYAAGAEYSVGAASIAGQSPSLTAVWEANTLSAPVITAPETYEGESATVTIAADSGSTIFYTTDGTEPRAVRSPSAPYQWISATSSTIQYQELFVVIGDVTVKAIAVRDDYFDSEVATAIVTRLPWTFGEFLNCPEQTFATSGDAEWTRVKGVSEDGYALKSGAVSHSQTSRLETVVSGPGTVTFACKVSGEIVKKIVYDGLAFCIDGVQQGGLIGNADWATKTFAVDGSGSHMLSWLYLKDEDGSVGEDCAWIDAVTWTPDESAAGGVAIQVDGIATAFEMVADGKMRTATVAAGTTAEDVKIVVGGVDVTAGFSVAVEGTTATVVLREPFERTGDAAVSSKQPYQENDDGKTVTLNVEVVPGLYYAADSAATIEALKRPGAAEPAKAGDAVVAPKQEGAQGFYKVWVSDAPIEAE